MGGVRGALERRVIAVTLVLHRDVRFPRERSTIARRTRTYVDPASGVTYDECDVDAFSFRSLKWKDRAA